VIAALRASIVMLAAGSALVGTGRTQADARLPEPLQAGRLDALLVRSGVPELDPDARRIVHEIYGRYIDDLRAMRDERAERFARSLDDLWELARIPDESEARRLLAEHRALCERIAERDRSLFADLSAALGGIDLSIAAGIRDVDRLAATMPFETRVGLRGDLFAIVEHLDLDEERKAAVLEIIARRDRELPPLVRRVWSEWRDLLVVAVQAIQEETGGLAALGAALSADEARRVRAAVLARCEEAIEKCRAARRKVRAVDDRIIEEIAAAIPQDEAIELRLRIAQAHPSGGPSRIVQDEAVHRCAVRAFPPGDAARALADERLVAWRAALVPALRESRAILDRAEDAVVLDPSTVAQMFGDVDAISELSELFEPLLRKNHMLADAVGSREAELAAVGIQVVQPSPSSDEGSSVRTPRLMKRTWERTFMASLAPTEEERAARRRTPSLFQSARAGIAPPIDRALVASRLDAVDDPIVAVILADHEARWSRAVEEPLRAVLADAAAMRETLRATRVSLDEAAWRALVARRDGLFFEAERVDRALFDALASTRRFDARALSDAALEREVDRELAAVWMSRLATANPWTAALDERLSDAARSRLLAVLAKSERVLLPDLRRSRATAFALATAADRDDLAIFAGDFGRGHAIDLIRADVEADAMLEERWTELIAGLVEAAGDERAAFEAIYATAASPFPFAWTPATLRLVKRATALDLADDRRAEIASLLGVRTAEAEAIFAERAAWNAMLRGRRGRFDAVDRLERDLAAADDRVRSEVLGLLRPSERAALREMDATDRILACGAEDADSAGIGEAGASY
jgi:hypothetical protein